MRLLPAALLLVASIGPLAAPAPLAAQPPAGTRPESAKLELWPLLVTTQQADADRAFVLACARRRPGRRATLLDGSECAQRLSPKASLVRLAGKSACPVAQVAGRDRKGAAYPCPALETDSPATAARQPYVRVTPAPPEPAVLVAPGTDGVGIGAKGDRSGDPKITARVEEALGSPVKMWQAVEWDLDSDGDLDLIAVVSPLAGKPPRAGPGRFVTILDGTVHDFPTIDGPHVARARGDFFEPRVIAVVDLDGDGRFELVVRDTELYRLFTAEGRLLRGEVGCYFGG